MRFFNVLCILLFSTFILMSFGCGGGGGSGGSIISTITGVTGGTSSTAQESKTATIPTSGGEVTLSNGIAAVIPTNALSADSNITLSRFDNLASYTKEYHIVLDFQATSAPKTMNLKVPVPSDKSPSGIVVVYENPTTKEHTIVGIATESINGSYNVTIDPSGVTPAIRSLLRINRQTGTATVANGTYIIEYVVSPPPKQNAPQYVKRIKMPYYPQDGGNCWAAVALMFAKGYVKYPPIPSIYGILRDVGVGRDDGIPSDRVRAWYWNGLLQAHTAKQISASVEAKRFWTMYSMLSYVFKALQENRPVQVNMIQHQGLFLGYEYSDVISNDKSKYISFIIHDSNNIGDQLPYMRITPEEIYKRHSGYIEDWSGILSNLGVGIITGYGAVACTNPISEELILQTIHLSDVYRDNSNRPSVNYSTYKGAEFRHDFGTFNGKPRKEVTDYMYWDHTAEGGLRQANNDVPNFSEFSLGAIPVSNMDDVPVELTIETKISAISTDTSAPWYGLAAITDSIKSKFGAVSNVSGSTLERQVAIDQKNITIEPGKVVETTIKFSADTLRNKILDSESRFRVDVTLKKAGVKIDGFSFPFTYRPFKIAQSKTTLNIGESATFTAVLQGKEVTSGVTWKIEESNGGSITSNGLYTAPTTPGTYHIWATYKDSVGTKVDVASITVGNTLSEQFKTNLTACNKCQITMFNAAVKFAYPNAANSIHNEWRVLSFKIPQSLPSNRSVARCNWSGSQFTVQDSFTDSGLNYSYVIKGTVDFENFKVTGEGEWSLTNPANSDIKTWKVTFTNVPTLSPENTDYFSFSAEGNSGGANIMVTQGRIWWSTTMYGDIVEMDTQGVQKDVQFHKTQKPSFTLAFSKY